VHADWIYTGRYDLQVEETMRLVVLGEMYRLAHYWGFEDSDLFKGLTRKLIESIGTRTYEDCESCWSHLFLSLTTDCAIYVVRRLAEGLSLEGGQLAEKCEEFERMNRSVLAENR
jgi:hypothetical protein